jgi:dephospho-CoA kinase
MAAIGITGGISTGKTSFCNCLREILPVAKFFNADQAAHELVDLPEVKEDLVRDFGAQIFSRAGDLNRDTLRAIIFKDAAKKHALEQILHPRIRRQWSALAETHRNSPDFFFADIPLLYETGGESLCDRVVVVACSRSVQLARLLERGTSNMAQVSNLCSQRRGQVTNLPHKSEAEEMINSQMPLEEKIRRADHVVWNNGDQAVLAEQAKSLVALWGPEKWTRE